MVHPAHHSFCTHVYSYLATYLLSLLASHRTRFLKAPSLFRASTTVGNVMDNVIRYSNVSEETLDTSPDLHFPFLTSNFLLATINIQGDRRFVSPSRWRILQSGEIEAPVASESGFYQTRVPPLRKPPRNFATVSKNRLRPPLPLDYC